MEKLINYKKQIIVIAVLLVVIVIGFGIYILHTTLNNINCSKNEAHVVALKQFPGTIVSSLIEYEDLKIYYEIEIENQQKEHIEVSIDAKSGKIIGYEYKE
ncbi:PepSY domain-containing protein [Thomasclavelia sp.]